MYDWADIPTFLAVMREGSAAAAARVLGTNQTTISRRIARLEAALSLRLFEPGARGAQPTANAHALMADAEAMEAAALALWRRVEGQRRNLSGVIRITTTPGVPRHLTGLLRTFQEIQPNVRFDIETTEDLVSLEKGEADVAVRAARQLTGDTLVARKLLDHPWAFYASESYVQRHGVPTSFEAMAGRHVVLYGEGVERRVDCVAEAQGRLPEGSGHFRVNSVEVMLGLLLEGEGPGLLPRAVGDLESGLRFCFTESHLVQRHWMVWTRHSEAVPHIGAFLKYCSKNLPQLLARFPSDWMA